MPVDWKAKAPGDILVERYVKKGECPGIPTDDMDDDGVVDGQDLCPSVPDQAQKDTDGDGFGDACDDDDDGDLVADSDDVCPRLADDQNQADSNGDGVGDACSNLVDEDGDGFLAPWDCDDSNPDANPDSPEACGGGAGGSSSSSGGGAGGVGGSGAASSGAGSPGGNGGNPANDGLVGSVSCSFGVGRQSDGLAWAWLVLLSFVIARPRRRSCLRFARHDVGRILEHEHEHEHEHECAARQSGSSSSA